MRMSAVLRKPRVTQIAAGLICLVAWLALGSRAIHAQGLSESQKARIATLVADAARSSRLPGISVAIHKGGEVWTTASGKADLEQDVPVTRQSRFRTGSIGKWLTATAAMRLVEGGRLDLDAPIQRYCPQFPAKQWPITARQLLTHTAGVRHTRGSNDEKRDSAVEQQVLDGLIRRERAEQFVRHVDVVTPLATFANDELLFEPGTSVRYSSLGYRVLGCVLEGAGRQPYRQLMRELVFIPAGMTAITDDDAVAVIPHRVAGYTLSPEKTIVRAPYRDVSENLPAGGFLSTAEDLVRFAAAFSAGTLVGAATRDRMLARPRLSDGRPAANPFGDPNYHYGTGIMVDPRDAQPAWFHTGGQAGASALLFWFPNDGVAVAVMTNIDGSAVRETLARRIAEAVTR